jgi:hypothetical protein
MRRIHWIAFSLLCALSGTSWAIQDKMDGLPVLERQGILFGAIGLIASLLARRKAWMRRGRGWYVQVSVAAVGLYGLPIVIGEYSREYVAGNVRGALYAMVPVVVVLAVAAGSGGEERGVRRFLVPALAGVGGLLLLLPLSFSKTIGGWVMLFVICTTVVLVGVMSVWLYRLLPDGELDVEFAVLGFANAAFLLGWSAVHEDMVWRASGLASVVSVSSFVDVVEVLLIVWLLRVMPPVRFASRYLLIPLLTVVEGFFVVRPELTVRIVSGTVLLAAGAGVLLFFNAEREERILSLR